MSNISKLYQDEAIPRVKNPTPPEYRRMREMIPAYGNSVALDAVIFHKQAKFMADFEDDYEEHASFMAQYPTYNDMNLKQLRTYFTWRTKLRRGDIQKVPSSYAYVYIYELLHNIGSKTVQEGYEKLSEFYATYRELDRSLDANMPTWLNDYVMYYGLENLKDTISDIDSAIIDLLDYETRSADEIFNALDLLSTNYKITQSPFYKKYPADVKAFVCRVFYAINKNYGKHTNKFFFGEYYSTRYRLFATAVFDQGRHEDCVYELNRVHRYRCENEAWFVERFYTYVGKEERLADLLKNADYFMRKEYGFKSTLKLSKSTEFHEIIKQELQCFIQEKEQAVQTTPVFDLAKLSDIRMAALETQNKLIVEEPEIIQECKEETGDGIYSISKDELECLKSLLTANTCKLKNINLLVDSINEKLFEHFGDTVIIESDKGFEIINDYIEDLKRMYANS